MSSATMCAVVDVEKPLESLRHSSFGFVCGASFIASRGFKELLSEAISSPLLSDRSLCLIVQMRYREEKRIT